MLGILNFFLAAACATDELTIADSTGSDSVEGWIAADC